MIKKRRNCRDCQKIVSENDLKFVLDADGISAFKGRLNLLKNKNIVMTPHAGEFSNLLGISNEEIRKDFYNYAIEFAKNIIAFWF
ncbi:MAG: hypothetical protein IPI04_02965 [Ignavibacteria bacterium]|nr:hypothetical protein [Ignavibacteria bacterium]